MTQAKRTQFEFAAAEAQQKRKFYPLTQADLDRGLTPEQKAELRSMLNVMGFLRELQRTGILPPIDKVEHED